MQVLIAIDDTDRAKQGDEVVRGTGALCGLLQEEIEKRGWGHCKPISRHQLLVHPDVPYTSHNSSMCFAAVIEDDKQDELVSFAAEFLTRESAQGSDPGFCMVPLERLTQPGWLVAFGYLAKNIVLTKDDAYQLADQLGIHLSEHGGTGGGVIGALAATGLRLSGFDGRFRGKLTIPDTIDGIASAGHILQTTFIEQIKDVTTGRIIDDECLIRLGEAVKPVLLYGRPVLLVQPTTADDKAKWETLSKAQIKTY